MLGQVPEGKRHQQPRDRILRPARQRDERHQGDRHRQAEVHPLEIQPADEAVREGGGLTVDVHLHHLRDVLDLMADLEHDGRREDKHHPRAGAGHLSP